jgi:hypothetical protein
MPPEEVLLAKARQPAVHHDSVDSAVLVRMVLVHTALVHTDLVVGLAAGPSVLPQSIK